MLLEFTCFLATNCYIADVDVNDTELSVMVKAYSHGHSTPQLAANFAKDINAECLIMNHFR